MPEQQFIKRPLTLEDAHELAKTLATIADDMGTGWRMQAETLQMDWSEPGMDITKSSLGFFTPDGQIVAYVVFWDSSDTPVRPYMKWGVHPDYLEHGFSTKIMQWAESRKDDLIRRCPPDARISIHSSTVLGYAPVEEALQQAGYSKIRTSYEMRIDMDTKPSVPTLPDGIKIRNYRHPEDLETFVTTFRNSFSDHYGYVEEPYEKDLEEFRHWFDTDKLFDPTFVILAVDEETDETAGYVLGFKEDHEDPSVSHIHLLGVARDYRRRGIAQAMLYYSFNNFYEHDRKSVTLGVDGDSLTNAVALYERVGMHIDRQYVRYEKVLREGQELATVALEA